MSIIYRIDTGLIILRKLTQVIGKIQNIAQRSRYDDRRRLTRVGKQIYFARIGCTIRYSVAQVGSRLRGLSRIP
jgi:hypothetical protein